MSKKKNSEINMETLEGEGLVDILKPRLTTFSNVSKNTLEQFGNKQIIRMWVKRQPIPAIIEKAAHLVTRGKLAPHDNYFHLSIIVNFGGAVNVIIEKNQEVNISTNYQQKSKNAQFMPVPISKYISLFDFIGNGIKTMGVRKFFDYESLENNCQHFISSLLTSSQLNNTQINNFVMQDMSDLIRHLPNFIRKTVKGVTRVANIANKLSGGDNDDNDLTIEDYPQIEAEGGNKKALGYMRMISTKKIKQGNLTDAQFASRVKSHDNFDITKPKKITKNLLKRRKEDKILQHIKDAGIKPDKKGLFSMKKILDALGIVYLNSKATKKKVSIKEPEKEGDEKYGLYILFEKKGKEKTGKSSGDIIKKKDKVTGKVLGTFETRSETKDFFDDIPALIIKELKKKDGKLFVSEKLKTVTNISEYNSDGKKLKHLFSIDSIDDTAHEIMVMIRSKFRTDQSKPISESTLKELIKDRELKNIEEKAKLKGSGLLDVLDTVAPFLGQASLKENKVLGHTSSDVLNHVNHPAGKIPGIDMIPNAFRQGTVGVIPALFTKYVLGGKKKLISVKNVAAVNEKSPTLRQQMKDNPWMHVLLLKNACSLCSLDAHEKELVKLMELQRNSKSVFKKYKQKLKGKGCISSTEIEF